MSTSQPIGKAFSDTHPLESNHHSMATYPPGDCTVIANQPYSENTGEDSYKLEPSGFQNLHPSLEYLSMIDQLIVHQKIEVLEVLCGCETENKYTIKNNLGQDIYKAVEDSDCCMRNCCGPLRPFHMKILDNNEEEVIHIVRDLWCQSCCFPCCLQRVEVFSPPGHLIGIIVQEWSILRPNLSVRSPEDKVLFRISGPLCQISCCHDLNFPIYDEESGDNIGKITKQWSGILREAITDADHFGITFPMELEVNKKAALIGALFLIDFMYFEKPNKPTLLQFL